MYYYISGKKIHVGSSCAIIDNNGIAYKMTVSDKTIGKLAAEGTETVKLYTYLVVREDAQELFGFYTLEEKTLFEMLIGVSGVGPKAAVAILSALSADELIMCIANEDAKSISTAQGIGIKTAQKVILELKDKVSKAEASVKSGTVSQSSAPAASDSFAQALDALCSLGYSRSEAMSALKFNGAQSMPLEALIREGLKRLTK